MYTYPTKETIKVPGHRPTEPSLDKLFQAIKLKKERETSLDGSCLLNDQREEYLDSIKEELKLRSQAWKHQTYEIGKLLWEVKKHLPHGKFQPWVEKNFELSYKTATNFMKVYRACMGHPEVVEYFNPSCLYVICKPDFPDDLREALFDGTKGPVDVSKKEIVQLAIKYKNGEVKTNDNEVQNILKRQRHISIWKKYKIELEALYKLVDGRLEKIKGLSKIHPVNPLIKDEDEEEEIENEDELMEFEAEIEKIKSELNVLINKLDEKCK